MKYYILCGPVRGELALWWRAERAGYTTSLDQAGQYDEVEALSIVRTRDTDIAIECGRVDRAAIRVVSTDTVRELTLSKGSGT